VKCLKRFLPALLVYAPLMQTERPELNEEYGAFSIRLLGKRPIVTTFRCVYMCGGGFIGVRYWSLCGGLAGSALPMA
jgi:hypothetical protein